SGGGGGGTRDLAAHIGQLRANQFAVGNQLGVGRAAGGGVVQRGHSNRLLDLFAALPAGFSGQRTATAPNWLAPAAGTHCGELLPGCGPVRLWRRIRLPERFVGPTHSCRPRSPHCRFLRKSPIGDKEYLARHYKEFPAAIQTFLCWRGWTHSVERLRSAVLRQLPPEETEGLRDGRRDRPRRRSAAPGRGSRAPDEPPIRHLQFLQGGAGAAPGSVPQRPTAPAAIPARGSEP